MTAANGYYEYYQDSADKWRWRFKANNHETIASGESYYNKQDCLHAIGLMKGSYDAPVYQR